MPRIALSDYVRKLKKPKINSISMIIDGYMEAAKLTSEDVGRRIGITGSAFRNLLGRPMGQWRLEEIEVVCGAVNCPIEEIYAELLKRSREQ